MIRTSFNGTPVEKQGGTSLGQAILEGLRYVFCQPVVYRLGLLTLLVNFAIAPINAQLVVFAVQVFAASNAQVGAFAAAVGIGGILATLVAGPLKRRLPYGVLLLSSLLLVGDLIIILAFMRSYWAAVVLYRTQWGAGTKCVRRS